MSNYKKMKSSFPIKTLIWVSLFGIAFGNIEATVVIYLRHIFYPEGFSFPLQIINTGIVNSNLTVVECVRELATMLLLVSIAAVSAKNFNSGFAWFIYAFAVWDIFYYVFLYLFIDWPQSLLTWDVLFLLPFTWIGPVIAPLINCVCMILLALVILQSCQQKSLIKKWHWAGLIIGSLIVIIAYTQDYVSFMSSDFSIIDLMNFNNSDKIIAKVGSYVPQSFAWWLFGLGVIIHLLVIGHIYFSSRKNIPLQDILVANEDEVGVKR